jgi:hypothetical protein
MGFGVSLKNEVNAAKVLNVNDISKNLVRGFSKEPVRPVSKQTP